MKLIISRKGFDSAAGGRPSPILPDGTLLSIPIPEPLSNIRTGYAYDKIDGGRWGSVLDIARQLGVDERVLARGAHFDPDLNAAQRKRHPTWRPALGQAHQAASHLRNQGVERGDLFVFFGLFRRTVEVRGTLRWDRAGRAEHLVFGWLVVGEVLRPLDHRWSWLRTSHADHPHIRMPFGPCNTMYLASADDASAPNGRGAGLCQRWSSARRLTAPRQTASTWRLPLECHPDRSGHPLSCHRAPKRWSVEGQHALLSTVGRGQEFVVDATTAWRDWAFQALTA